MQPFCVTQAMREVRLREISLHNEADPEANHPKLTRGSPNSSNCINWADKERDRGLLADDRDDAEHQRRVFSYQLVPHTADRHQEDGNSSGAPQAPVQAGEEVKPTSPSQVSSFNFHRPVFYIFKKPQCQLLLVPSSVL